MKTVRLQNNVVTEIIREYALPVAKWYGENFAAQCVEAPDTVEQGWIYDEATTTFSAAISADPTQEPSQLDRVEAQATYTAMMTDTLLEE